MNYETGMLLKQQEFSQRSIDELSECIANAKSLATVALGCDIENFHAKVVHDYWGALTSLLEKAEGLCGTLLDARAYV